MSSRRHSAKRSPTEWAVRGVLALSAVMFGYLATVHSLASSLANADPARAYALSDWDGQIGGLFARRLSEPDATPADRTRSDRIAREALRLDSTSVAAAATLGINAQLRGDAATASRRFGYAETLSRRDIPTQLWAIEDAVGRNDISEALRHYDIALRVLPSASAALFPVLAAGSAEPAIAQELVKTLAGRPSWGARFIDYAAGNAPDPEALVRLLRGLTRAGVEVSGQAHSLGINRLLGGGLFQAAWDHYAQLRSGVRRGASRDPRFTAALDVPSLLDWYPLSQGGVEGTLQSERSGGSVSLSAPSGVGGALLQQWQLLRPGDYRLEGHSDGIDQPPTAAPYWVMHCRGGREIGRVTIPNSAENGGRFAGMFRVPVDCAAQTLTLVAQATDKLGGLTGSIDRVQLRPAGG